MICAYCWHHPALSARLSAICSVHISLVMIRGAAEVLVLLGRNCGRTSSLQIVQPWASELSLIELFSCNEEKTEWSWTLYTYRVSQLAAWKELHLQGRLITLGSIRLCEGSRCRKKDFLFVFLASKVAITLFASVSNLLLSQNNYEITQDQRLLSGLVGLS